MVVAPPTVYFIPALMGSALSVQNAPVWLDTPALLWGDFSRLRGNTTETVAASGVLVEYAAWLQFLTTTFDVVSVAYDWRVSVLENARQFAQQLEQRLDEAAAQQQQMQIRLVAHGSGGGLIQALPVVNAALWLRLQKEAECRCIFVGSPLAGSYSTVQLLMGEHRLVRLLDAVENTARGGSKIAEQFAGYLGVLETLPLEFLQLAHWESPLAGRLDTWAARDLLPLAQQTRQQLAAVAFNPAHTVYIHGQSALTPSDLVQQGDLWRMQASVAGDGVTLWQSVQHLGLSTYCMPVEHGRMLSQPVYFEALAEIIAQGHTSRLAVNLPSVHENAIQWLPRLPAKLVADENGLELMAAALGYHTLQTQAEVRPLVEVRVTHGNLEYSKHPIAVGHYAGEALTGAEAVLDRALDGKLSDALRLGAYPVALESANVFFNPNKRPAGALVIGLGEVGKLSVAQLTQTVSIAMRQYALAVREQLEQDEQFSTVDGDTLPIHIASLLMGTLGGGALGIDDTITAILRGVAQANQALQKTERGLIPRLHTLEFIELYEDRAVEAAHLIRNFVNQPEFRETFTAARFMQTALGRRRRVYFSETSPWWRRLQIDADANGLKYTALTDRARAEMLVQATQRNVVDEFIEKAITTNQDDPDVGKVLFELLLPPDMKNQPPHANHVVLVLNDAAAVYPWELLYNRLDAESLPLSVRSGLIRQLQVGQFRQTVSAAIERSALVIGNPLTEGAFLPLPAAASEAKAVAKVLENNGFSRVVSVIEQDAQAILQALHSHDYRVLHLAGHGVYQYSDSPDAEPVTGMVLNNGLFLTALEINQMRRVPELAFINCCHLATIATTSHRPHLPEDRTKLAASLAKALISIGVRAVIAAGWTINDAAAKVFASTCYAALLDGYTFGKAVLLARQETWQRYPSDNTWGAYQCYGDPDYRLVTQRSPEAGENTARTWMFVSEAEVHAELQNFINHCDSADVKAAEALLDNLQQLHSAIPREWQHTTQTLALLGKAYGKIECYAQAVGAYDAVMQSSSSDYPFGVLEEKAGLQTAWALAWSRGQLADSDLPSVNVARTPLELLDSGLRLLKLLSSLGNSQRRMEEEGKLWKRRAMLTEGLDRATDLAAMEKAYQHAHEAALNTHHQVSPYPLLNWLTVNVIRGLRDEQTMLDTPTLQKWLQQAKDAMDAEDRIEPTFSNGISRAEHALIQYLIGARFEELVHIRQIATYYQRALQRGAAPRQVGFIHEHVDFIYTMLQTVPTTTIQPVRDALLLLKQMFNPK